LWKLAFINALDIEEYLRSKGAVNLDQKILQIRAQGSSEVDGLENSVLSFDMTPPDIEITADSQHFDLIAGPTKPAMFGNSEDIPMNSKFASNSFCTVYQTPSCLGKGVLDSNSNISSEVLDVFYFKVLLQRPEEQLRKVARYISARPKAS
jgi:hypothetical protein